MRRRALATFLLGAAVAAPHAAAAEASGGDLASEDARVTLPARVTLADALRILREHGLDLLIADAAIASAEGDVTAAGAIQNPTVSGGVYRSFFSGHLYESHLGWFVGAQILSDVTSSYAAFQGSRELVTRMETEMLAQVARVRDLVDIQYQKGAASLLDYLDAYRTYIATNVEYIQDLAAYWSAEHALEGAVAMRFE